MPSAKPVDTSVKVPAAVTRAAEASAAAHAAAYPNSAPPAADPLPVDPNISIVEPPAPSLEIVDITAPQTAPSAAVITPQGNPPPADDPNPNGETWRHKFNSVNGRYTRLEQIVRQQESTIASQQEQIDSMNEIMQAMAQQPAPSVSPPAPTQSLITDEDRKQYGDEFIDIVQRAARDALSGDLSGLQGLLSGVDQKVTTVDTRIRAETDAQRKQAMEHRLDVECPTWRDINFMPEFKSWLLLQNPYTGDIRNNELQAAWGARKAPQVIAFFKGFLSEQATVAPLVSTAPQPANQPAPGIALEDLAAPGRARAPAANEPPAEKPIITRSQISAFYTDVQKGKYRGRDEEKNRTEAMITAAAREGRVR